MKYGINIFSQIDLIDQLAKSTGNVIMHIEAVGPNSTTDPEKLEEVWDFYYGKCDNDVLNAIRQFRELFCYFVTVEQAVDAMEEWFPKKHQLMDDEQHFYISCYVVSPDGSVRLENL